MKAIVHTKYGPPDELELKEVDKPVPKDDQVLKRMTITMFIPIHKAGG